MGNEYQVDIDQAYKSSMDSVNLINRLYDEGLTVGDEYLDTIDRNKRHLVYMLAKDFWTEEQDLTPFSEAVDRTE